MTLSAYVALLLLFLSACYDLCIRKVPNQLLLPFMLAGVLYQCFEGSFLTALSGTATAFSLTFLPVVMRGMGMGDQKLLMAVGVWLPALDVFTLFVCSIFAGLVCALLAPTSWKNGSQNIRLLAAGWVAHRKLWLPEQGQSALTLPYAVCLFFAYLFLLMTEGI